MTNFGGVHQLLGFDVVAGAAAFDHVAGEREGRAAETDDAELVGRGVGGFGAGAGGEVGGDFFDRVGDVQQILRPVGAEGAGLVGGAEGRVDLGAFVGDELE